MSAAAATAETATEAATEAATTEAATAEAATGNEKKVRRMWKQLQNIQQLSFRIPCYSTHCNKGSPFIPKFIWGLSNFKCTDHLFGQIKI